MYKKKQKYTKNKKKNNTKKIQKTLFTLYVCSCGDNALCRSYVCEWCNNMNNYTAKKHIKNIVYKKNTEQSLQQTKNGYVRT